MLPLLVMLNFRAAMNDSFKNKRKCSGYALKVKEEKLELTNQISSSNE